MVMVNSRNPGYWYEARQVCVNDWFKCKAFKITDQRYKPADTSYLQTPAAEAVEESTSWYDYENQKALRLPDVGAECEVEFANRRFGWSKCSVDYIGKCIVVVTAACDGDEVILDSDESDFVRKFRPLDHATRKAELEKKMLIEQAKEACFAPNSQATMTTIECLIAAGWRPSKD